MNPKNEIPQIISKISSKKSSTNKFKGTKRLKRNMLKETSINKIFFEVKSIKETSNTQTIFIDNILHGPNCVRKFVCY